MTAAHQLEDITFDSLHESSQKFLYSDTDLAFITDVEKMPQYMGVRLMMYLIISCQQGKITFKHNGTEQTLMANEMYVFTPSSVMTDLMMSSDNKMRLIFISQRGLQGLLHNEISVWNRAIFVDRQLKFKVSSQRMQQLTLYEDLFKSKLKTINEPYGRLSITAVFKGFLYDLCGVIEQGRKSNSQNAGPQVIATTKPQEVIFRNFINNLQNEKKKRQPVSYYAEQLCISSKYLSTIVKQASNRTVMEWIHEYVNADIEYYLYNTSMSIKEICHTLNFTNLSFFGKYVKTQFGCSPRKLRARSIKANQQVQPRH